MRLLHFSKVVFFALLLLLVPVAASTAEPAEAAPAPAFFGDVAAWFGELVAGVFATETPADPEGSPVFPPGGLTATEDQADLEGCPVYPPGG